MKTKLTAEDDAKLRVDLAIGNMISPAVVRSLLSHIEALEAEKAEAHTDPENPIRCRDCKHWKTRHPEMEETYARNRPPDKGWWDGVCKRLQHGITISASGGWDGATVDSVETDGNFGCVYGEKPVAPIDTSAKHVEGI